MSMKNLCLILCLGFVGQLFSTDVVLGQACPPGKSYPYTFCIGGTKSEIRCSSCPTNSGQGTPLTSGFPSCTTINNDAGASTIVSYATNNPCDRTRTIWDFSNLAANLTTAMGNWMGICPSNPSVSCCWELDVTSNSSSIQQITGLSNDPAASSFTFLDGDCKADCGKFKTFLNFSDDFFGQVFTFTDNDPVSGNPCDVDLTENTWVDPQDEGNISATAGHIYYYNTVDVLTHEFGHLLGVPEEKNFPAACALTGIMNGVTMTGGVIQHKGLPPSDDARCWFKQLYCPDPCTDAVSSMSPPPDFALGQPFPNPLSGNTLDVPYSIGSAGHLSITLFDVLGKQVGNSFESKSSPGTYDYPLNCGGLASGSYYVRLSLDGYPMTKRISIKRDH